MSTALAVVCTLLFESPFIGLEKIIFSRGGQKRPQQTEGHNKVRILRFLYISEVSLVETQRLHLP